MSQCLTYGIIAHISHKQAFGILDNETPGRSPPQAHDISVVKPTSECQVECWLADHFESYYNYNVEQHRKCFKHTQCRHHYKGQRLLLRIHPVYCQLFPESAILKYFGFFHYVKLYRVSSTNTRKRLDSQQPGIGALVQWGATKI